MRKPFAALTIGAIAAATLIGGCAGRDPNPVQTVKATDGMLNCQFMLAEINANNTRARSLAKQASDKQGKNVALGVVGVVLFWPALFAMDLKDAEKQEIAALRDRNNYLANLMLQKKCAMATPPLSPEKEDQVVRHQRANKAKAAGKKPKCADVGGYEKYMKETGEVCTL